MRESLTNSRETVRKLVIGCISILGLLGAGTGKAEAQDVNPAREKVERNFRALRIGEYLVSDKVITIFNQVYQVYQINLKGEIVFGLYIGEDNQRFSPSRKAEFDEKIKELNLPKDEIVAIGEMFKTGNIVFGRWTINNPNFIKFLQHERIHKYMAEDLSAEEKRALDEVRYFYIGKKGAKPTLQADNTGEAAEFQLFHIMNAKEDEFWSTLIEGNFTNVESYIAEHFPEASAIYKRMKTKATAEKK